jgi:ribosomal protein L7/L12
MEDPFSAEEIELIKNIRHSKGISLKEALDIYREERIITRIDNLTSLEDVKEILKQMLFLMVK